MDSRLIDLIWAAGFWEGEGSCGVYKTNKTFKRLVMSVVQVDEEPIKKFKSLFGGSSTITVRDGFKDIYKWELAGTNAYIILKTFRPYIISKYKQEQIDSTLLSWDEYRTTLGKTKYITKRCRTGKYDVYEVRINDNGETKFLGSFRDPSHALNILYLHAAKRGLEIYDYSKK